MSVQIINKENIQHMGFISMDALNNEQERSLRLQKLQRAQSLGNLYKHHVKVIFYNDKLELMQTVATVWAVTEKFIVLKGGTSIPIHSIRDLEEFA